MSVTRAEKRQKVKYRIRKRISGNSETPRLSVFRSNTTVYCQLIDDTKGSTLASANSKDKSIGKMNKSEQAKAVGKLIADKAKSLNITKAVFDRNGFLYHGRVKALADGAREAGLQI